MPKEAIRTLLGDPVANTTTGTEKGQKDKIGIDYI